MARVVAAVRLLWVVTRKDLKGLSSLGLNNLFFCMAFLVQGSHSARTAFYAALPFVMVLVLPLLAAISMDTLERIPKVRVLLWPLSARERVGLGVVGLALSPAFWLLGGVMWAWAGVAAAIFFLGLSVAMQGIVFLGARLSGGRGWLRVVPRWPGGIVQVTLRQIFSSLDFYAALLLSVAGTAYRMFAAKPQVEAYPMLALLIALTLSTYAQRMFGLESVGSMARYRLLPMQGWKILLAKDAAYFGVLAVLTMPLGLLPGLVFGLVAVAVGRWPSLHQNVRERAWRFTGGDVRFGVLQILVGGVLAMGSLRVSHWFVAGAVGCYGLSVVGGEFWWRRVS